MRRQLAYAASLVCVACGLFPAAASAQSQITGVVTNPSRGVLPGLTVHAVSLQQAPGPPAAASFLDFEYFRTKVQPILLATRDGHTRCVTCHSQGTPMRLQALSPGASTWNEEQSRRNFQVVSPRVIPLSPLQSKLLLHPLMTEAGGDYYHGGGKHWDSFLDPEWQTIANWVCGRKATEKIVELTGACGE